MTKTSGNTYDPKVNDLWSFNSSGLNMTVKNNSYGKIVEYSEFIENRHTLKNLFRSRTKDCVVSTLEKTADGSLSVVGTPSEGLSIY